MTMKDIAVANSSYVALVTRGNRGIARQVARQFATLPAKGPTGGSAADRKQIEW
jgi:hypothetical protein